MDWVQYRDDHKTQAAVERELEKISEACTKIRELEADCGFGSDVKHRLDSRFPGVPWRQIRAIGNRLRHEHEYGRIDPQVIWNTAVSSDLTDLETALRSILES